MEQKHSEESSGSIPPFLKIIGSGFYSGYSPFASGTVGSLIALFFFLIPGFHHFYNLIPAILIGLSVGGIAADRFEKVYGPDPKQVTIDEVVGMWISLLSLPLSLPMVVAAFLIFRILDILKPYPANHFDNKPGGWNIMWDDVIAGIYTNVILQIAFRFFPSLTP